MAEVIDLTEDDFYEKTKKGKWIVDIWAVWCGPCKLMKKEIEEAAKSISDKINFAKVNIDENYNLAQKFEIRAVPTLLFIKDGEVVEASVGMIPKDQIIELAEEVFGK